MVAYKWIFFLREFKKLKRLIFLSYKIYFLYVDINLLSTNDNISTTSWNTCIFTSEHCALGTLTTVKCVGLLVTERFPTIAIMIVQKFHYWYCYCLIDKTLMEPRHYEIFICFVFQFSHIAVQNMQAFPADKMMYSSSEIKAANSSYEMLLIKKVLHLKDKSPKFTSCCTCA